jgi:hypothetical protein
MERNRNGSSQSRETGAATQPDGPEAAFDLWLEQRLHQLYDSVAQEPVPPELLDLIEADRTRRGKP